MSGIVEADPEVLRDKRVQAAVEGRFCDSAISVREAALELVGRHIASHPDVGLQVLVLCKMYRHYATHFVLVHAGTCVETKLVCFFGIGSILRR